MDDVKPKRFDEAVLGNTNEDLENSIRSFQKSEEFKALLSVWVQQCSKEGQPIKEPIDVIPSNDRISSLIGPIKVQEGLTNPASPFRFQEPIQQPSGSSVPTDAPLFIYRSVTTDAPLRPTSREHPYKFFFE